MRISIDWLKEFVSLPDNITPQQLADDLTLKVVEVEELIDQGASLDHVVVGVVTQLAKHPNADSLTLCQVDIGNEVVPIVCGGSNLKEGMKVALAKVGAKVHWHGEEKLMELKKTNIRGEVSMGMICAGEEIGLADLFEQTGEKEICDLSFLDAPAGTALAQALAMNDVIVDIDNKSMTHRPDLWGHYGMAREVAAIYESTHVSYEPPTLSVGKEMSIHVDVEDSLLCPRYMAVAMEGIEVGPSPMWMQRRLLAVGVQPINNIVDISNYVMFELGQPMHAFDANYVDADSSDKHIYVRKAKKGEKLVLLGEEEITLEPSMLVIADSTTPIALAGIKGGHTSGVQDSTERIIFEAANFDSLNIRRTASTFNLRTDASSRFEKGLDPHVPELALRRAVELTMQLCPNAKVISNIADSASFSLNQGPISISVERICSRIGVELSSKEITQMLERIGFHIQEKNGELSVTIPSWRATGDIAIADDLIEEVARLYGYGNIPTTFPKFPISPAPLSPLRDLEKQIKELLAYESGFSEVYNYSFVSPDWLEKLGISPKDHIELANPLAKDRPFVRRSLVPNMLMNIETNIHRFDRISLCETGRGYKKEEQGPQAEPDKKDMLPGQDLYLGLLHIEKGNSTPFFTLSNALAKLFDRLGVAYEICAEELNIPFVHPTRQANIIVQGQVVGWLAEVHPRVQQEIGLEERIATGEINLDTLVTFVQERIAYRPLGNFPAVDRDVAFMLAKGVRHAAVVEVIEKNSPLIESVELFDVYDGEHIEDGKKSLAYRIVYRSAEKTLTAQEVDELHQQVLQSVQKEFDAVIR